MAAAIAVPAGVSARPRPRFEPTDLEWEETGVFEVDLEVGAIREPGTVALRWSPTSSSTSASSPTSSWASTARTPSRARRSGAFSFDHARRRQPVAVGEDRASTTITTSRRSARARSACSSAPGCPSPRGAHGLGGEALVVSAARRRGADRRPQPRRASSSRRQDAISRTARWACEAGVDLELQLDSADRFQLTGELAGSFSSPPTPISCTRPRGSPGRSTRTSTCRSSGSSASWRATTATASWSAVEPKLRLFDAPPAVHKAGAMNAPRSIAELAARIVATERAPRRPRRSGCSTGRPSRRRSLGRLEDLACQLAAIRGDATPRPRPAKAIVVMGADHGVAEEGVSAYPQEVTGADAAQLRARRRGDQRAGAPGRRARRRRRHGRRAPAGAPTPRDPRASHRRRDRQLRARARR